MNSCKNRKVNRWYVLGLNLNWSNTSRPMPKFWLGQKTPCFAVLKTWPPTACHACDLGVLLKSDCPTPQCFHFIQFHASLCREMESSSNWFFCCMSTPMPCRDGQHQKRSSLIIVAIRPMAVHCSTVDCFKRRKTNMKKTIFNHKKQQERIQLQGFRRFRDGWRSSDWDCEAVILLATLACFAALLFLPELVASGLLAYSFGLRHAVDVDHIDTWQSVQCPKNLLDAYDCARFFEGLQRFEMSTS